MKNKYIHITYLMILLLYISISYYRTENIYNKFEFDNYIRNITNRLQYAEIYSKDKNKLGELFETLQYGDLVSLAYLLKSNKQEVSRICTVIKHFVHLENNNIINFNHVFKDNYEELKKIRLSINSCHFDFKGSDTVLKFK